MLQNGIYSTVILFTLNRLDGQMVLEEICAMSSELLLALPMGQAQMYPTARVDKSNNMYIWLQSNKILASWQLAEISPEDHFQISYT